MKLKIALIVVISIVGFALVFAEEDEETHEAPVTREALLLDPTLQTPGADSRSILFKIAKKIFKKLKKGGKNRPHFIPVAIPVYPPPPVYAPPPYVPEYAPPPYVPEVPAYIPPPPPYVPPY